MTTGPHGTAHVTYNVTVHGQERTFTADTTVSGSGAEAALSLIHAVREDADDWLRAEKAKAPTHVLVKSLFGRVKVLSKHVEPERVLVAATAEINGVIHKYSGEVSTGGNPYQAALAALTAAQHDLWDWAWAQKRDRSAVTA